MKKKIYKEDVLYKTTILQKGCWYYTKHTSFVWLQNPFLVLKTRYDLSGCYNECIILTYEGEIKKAYLTHMFERII